MKNDINSGLCIKQIVSAVIAILVIGFSIELITHNSSSIELAKTEIQEETVQNVEQGETTQEREVTLASRSAEEINLNQNSEQQETAKAQEESNEQNYITIEEIKISKDMDLTQRCGISKEDFKTLLTNLKRDTSGFFEENSDTIYDLCEQYELNEIFFCGLIAGESGWNIATSHRNANNYISMMSGGRLIRYSSVAEGLEAAAKLLHNKYLTEGGSYYCGKTLYSVQKRFCPNSKTWVNLIYTCMSQIV